MGSTREFSRTNSYAPCILNFNGMNYGAHIKNIGIGGAAIEVDSDLQYNLHIGDKCRLMLLNETDEDLTNYACEVSRLDSSELGVSFYKLF